MHVSAPLRTVDHPCRRRSYFRRLGSTVDSMYTRCIAVLKPVQDSKKFPSSDRLCKLDILSSIGPLTRSLGQAVRILLRLRKLQFGGSDAPGALKKHYNRKDQNTARSHQDPTRRPPLAWRPLRAPRDKRSL